MLKATSKDWLDWFLLANLCTRLRVRISFLISELNQGLSFNLILTNLEGYKWSWCNFNKYKMPCLLKRSYMRKVWLYKQQTLIT
jgi:hypothetical protein